MDKIVATSAAGVVLLALAGCSNSADQTQGTPGATSTVSTADAASCIVGAWSMPLDPGYEIDTTFETDGTFVFTRVTVGALGTDGTEYHQTETVEGTYEVVRDTLTAEGTASIALVRTSDGEQFGAEVLGSDPGQLPVWLEAAPTAVACDGETLVLTTTGVHGDSHDVEDWKYLRS
ncbi:MAG: hypothetical protein FWF02_07160 [Micrococcales bacterium]|nr:hypothetical protein [Micrococcales bacterium]MCL2667470.1 hypothetical protein [Micrococcales bacterium]